MTNSHDNPGRLSRADLARYPARVRDPVCVDYRQWKVCSAPPPSSGGIAVLQILKLLERFDLARVRPNSAAAVHLFAEANRLAFADRNCYLADPDFLKVPTNGAAGRHVSRRPLHAHPLRQHDLEGDAGRLPMQTGQAAPLPQVESPSTTHISIVDRDGNAVSFTSSIEDSFGSRLMVGGFLLNNQLTDFSFEPTRDGMPVANRVEPGKRPRSSMAPTMVFDKNGRLLFVLGSPGGRQHHPLCGEDADRPPRLAARSAGRDRPAEHRQPARRPSWSGHRAGGQVMALAGAGPCR